jgi:hypothetical protein
LGPPLLYTYIHTYLCALENGTRGKIKENEKKEINLGSIKMK